MNGEFTIYPTGDHRNIEPTGGLTKREYIAVAVLNGLISAWGAHDITNYAELSHDAVMAADALIERLNQPKNL